MIKCKFPWTIAGDFLVLPLPIGAFRCIDADFENGELIKKL